MYIVNFVITGVQSKSVKATFIAILPGNFRSTLL